MTSAGRTAWWTVLGVMVACVASGCSSAPKSEGAATAESLRSVADQLARGRSQLEATMASLEAMTSASETSLNSQYKAFADNVTKLEKIATSIRKSTDAMRGKGDLYLETWDADLAEIQNESIRSRSEARQEEVRKALEKTRADYEALGEAFRPLMADLKDLRAALKTDLTPSGVDSLSGPIEESQKRASTVLAKADVVADDLRALGVSLSSAGE